MSEFEDTMNDPEAMTPEVVALSARPSPLPGPPQVVYESNPTGRWSRSEPEIQQMRFHPRPDSRLPDLDLSNVEERILAATSPEEIAAAKAAEALRHFRTTYPEIVEAYREFAKPGGPARESFVKLGSGNRALRRAANKGRK